MTTSKFKLCLVIYIRGQSAIPEHLRLQIETFMTQTVVPLLSQLKNESEQLEITINIVDCDEADDVEVHQCLTKITTGSKSKSRKN